MGRSPCCENAHTNKRTWTKEEDQRLISYIKSHGESCWRYLPKSAGLLWCSKSCRLCWINYLRLDLKCRNFTEAEDKLIIKLHSLLGSKWSLIASHLLLTVLSRYVELLHRGTHPDNFTLPFLLTSNPYIHSCQQVHAYAVILGFTSDPFVHIVLVTMYVSIMDAIYMFDEIQDKYVVSWTTMISGLVDVGCHGNALKVFTAMRSGSYVRQIMSTCASLGSLNNAYIFHGYLHKVVPEGELILWNSLMDLYAKCGSIGCAVRVFNSMKERDMHSWTTMIMGMTLHGLGKEAIGLFSRMGKVGVKPDSITFITVLSACSHVGLMDEGIRIFETIESVYEIISEDFWSCMELLRGSTLCNSESRDSKLESSSNGNIKNIANGSEAA